MICVVVLLVFVLGAINEFRASARKREEARKVAAKVQEEAEDVIAGAQRLDETASLLIERGNRILDAAGAE